jgi:hypothetical protein
MKANVLNNNVNIRRRASTLGGGAMDVGLQQHLIHSSISIPEVHESVKRGKSSEEVVEKKHKKRKKPSESEKNISESSFSVVSLENRVFSTKDILRRLVEEAAKEDAILKKSYFDIQTANNRNSFVEFQSLAIEKPVEEEYSMKTIRQRVARKSLAAMNSPRKRTLPMGSTGGTAGGNGSGGVGTNILSDGTTLLSDDMGMHLDNKIAYKNSGMWSVRSATLEQLLKPLLSVSVNTWPDYETFNQIVSTQANIVTYATGETATLNVPVWDTLLIRLEEAKESRYVFDRICSDYSFIKQEFTLKKVCTFINFVIRTVWILFGDLYW